MIKSRQHNVFTRLFNLACQKHFVQNRIDLVTHIIRYLFSSFNWNVIIYLVKVKDQIQFTDVAKESIQHFDKEMNCFEISEFVIVGIDAYTKEQACVTTIHNLVVSKLEWESWWAGGLLLFFFIDITSMKLLWCFWSLGAINRCTSPLSLTFSSSSYGTYHFANLVFPWRFCTKINRIYRQVTLLI